MTQRKKPKLSPEWIDRRAYKIVETLQNRGFTTYLVGGCVRDLLLGIDPKDYDIATDARPKDVKRAISHAYIIGKRFRLVLVKRDEQQYEVATFRRDIREDENAEDLPSGDNIWGSPEEDAKRRDFSINAMFYDPIKDEVIDFEKGKQDLKEGTIRIIGDPQERLIEDPIRILRAIRLAHKIRFSLDSTLRKAIADNAETLEGSALPRRREEFLKFLRVQEPLLPFLDCYDLDVFKYVSPTLHKIFEETEIRREFARYMQNYHDYEIDSEQPLELFAMLCLAVVRTLYFKDVHKPIRTKEILEHPEIKAFMRDELGMFNYEQSAFAKALHMQSTLMKASSFNQRGERRKIAVIKNEAFPLALAIAQRDHSLNAEDSLFWYSEYQKYLPEILREKSQNEKRRGKKTRRKKRTRKKNLA